MPPLAIAGVVAAGIGAGSTIIAGNKAAKATTEAASTAAATQERMFDKAQALNEPWVTAGMGALDVLTDTFVTGNNEDIMNLPGIRFMQEQGEQFIGRSQAAKGDYLSGAALKEGIRFTEGLASTALNEEYNRLYGISSLGQAAAAGTAGQAISTGVGIAQTDLIAGQARANQAINVGSAINTGLNNLLYGAAQGGLFDKKEDTGTGNPFDYRDILDEYGFGAT